MSWRWHSPEQIASALAEVKRARQSGLTLSQAIRSVDVSEATYFRWQALYGALGVEEISKLRRGGARAWTRTFGQELASE